MKLRIQGNSLRLRLTQTETRNIGRGLEVSERVNFGKVALTYVLTSAEVRAITASLAENRMVITLPADAARHWAASEEVGIYHTIATGHDELLSITVEKDFKCLHKETKEEERDMFPNPDRGIRG